jgi:hypothetical protein
MYRSEQSSKSFLVLNLLSYVDAIRPKYCVFENVRGIFHWRLMAARQSAYTTTGGIPMGGLKLVLRCLVDLGFVCVFITSLVSHEPHPATRSGMVFYKRVSRHCIAADVFCSRSVSKLRCSSGPGTILPYRCTFWEPFTAYPRPAHTLLTLSKVDQHEASGESIYALDSRR